MRFLGAAILAGAMSAAPRGEEAPDRASIQKILDGLTPADMH